MWDKGGRNSLEFPKSGENTRKKIEDFFRSTIYNKIVRR